MPSFERFFERLCASTSITSQTELARQLGVNRSAVTQAKERGSVPERWVYKLANTFSLDPEWLGGDEESGPPGDTPDTTPGRIPNVSPRLSAAGEFLPAEERKEPPVTFTAQGLQGQGDDEQMVLMDVYGDCMAPLLTEGDTVLIDRTRTDIVSGRIYALGVHRSVLIRRVERHPGQIVLQCTNPAYAPVHVPDADRDSVRILGQVIWMCRAFL